MDTERNGEFLEIIKSKLTPARLYHSICVAEQAEKLAKIFGENSKKAYTAGLVHDIMKYASPEEMIDLIQSDVVSLSESEKKATKIQRNPKLDIGTSPNFTHMLVLTLMSFDKNFGKIRH